ncbi:MAG: hypothetical protein P0Y55_07865 [Candidatus Cohnella colombiensis]|uniref:Uncharacterized protein n=1 Tax=Candidatus Cohnella colombiensis TaxID=3121368 RepID=A0AA95EZS2_9BACL|nr:MAG: hypothetical protein P0Y55_07865 [Cohnella sp.]
MKQMKRGIAVLGILGACALCCAIPLIGGAAVLGISSFFLNPLVIAILVLSFIIAGIVIYKPRKVTGSSCMKSGCNCNSCSKG